MNSINISKHSLHSISAVMTVAVIVMVMALALSACAGAPMAQTEKATEPAASPVATEEAGADAMRKSDFDQFDDGSYTLTRDGTLVGVMRASGGEERWVLDKPVLCPNDRCNIGNVVIKKTTWDCDRWLSNAEQIESRAIVTATPKWTQNVICYNCDPAAVNTPENGGTIWAPSAGTTEIYTAKDGFGDTVARIWAAGSGNARQEVWMLANGVDIESSVAITKEANPERRFGDFVCINMCGRYNRLKVINVHYEMSSEISCP